MSKIVNISDMLVIFFVISQINLKNINKIIKELNRKLIEIEFRVKEKKNNKLTNL